jgi:ribosomal RNA-processing protein 17
VDVTRDGFTKAYSTDDPEQRGEGEEEGQAQENVHKNGLIEKKPSHKVTKKPQQKRTKKKKFRYESKADRKVTRMKERLGSAKARARRKT